MRKCGSYKVKREAGDEKVYWSVYPINVVRIAVFC